MDFSTVLNSGCTYPSTSKQIFGRSVFQHCWDQKMFSKTHSTAYMRCDFLGFNLITALKEDTFDYWSCCEWMQLPKQKCERCAFCNNIDDWLKGRGLTTLYFGFPCMYSVSFNRVTSSLPNIFISQGTNSIVQVMTPRDLLTNQVVSQTLWSEFKPVTLWKQKKKGLTTSSWRWAPIQLPHTIIWTTVT